MSTPDQDTPSKEERKASSDPPYMQQSLHGSFAAFTPQKVQRKSISGKLTVKRKNLWVSRYAEIKDCVFTYKEKQSETKPKFMLDLRTASITQGRRKNDERYFVITNKLGETLQVTFENYAEYKKWGDVFVESMQSDEQLYKQQIEPKMREEEARIRKEHDDELQSQYSNFKASRSTFKRDQRALYCGSFKRGDAKGEKSGADELAAIQKLWSQLSQQFPLESKQGWNLCTSKGSLQVFTSVKSLNLSSKVQMRQEISRQIAESKVRPLEPARDPLPYLLAIGTFVFDWWGCFEEHSFYPMSFDMKCASWAYLLVMIMCQEIRVQSQKNSYREQLVQYEKKVDIPNSFSGASFQLKLTGVFEAAPEEITQFLANGKLRACWDQQLVKQESLEGGWLSLKYENCSTEYQVRYNCVFEDKKTEAARGRAKKAKRFLISEEILINKGLQRDQRFYKVEEILNRDNHLRVSLFAKVKSESEARNLIRQFSSLRNAVQQADRPKALIGSFSQLSSSRSSFQNRGTVASVMSNGRASTFGLPQFSSLEMLEEHDESSYGSESDADSNEAKEIEEPSESPNKKANAAQAEEKENKEEKEEPAAAEIVEERPKPEPKEEDLGHPGKSLTSIDLIDDEAWPARMDEYQYSDYQRKFVQMCLEKKREFFETLKLTDWKDLVSDPKSDIHIQNRTSARKFPTMKSVGHLDYSPKQVWLTLCSGLDYRTSYDKNCEDTFIIEKKAANCYVVYQKVKKVAIVASRDFVMCNFVQETDDGCCMILVFTCDELTEGAKAPVKSTVRADNPVGGWWLEPVDGGTRTKATFMVELDLKGVPNWVLNQAFKDQGYQIKPLRDTVKKFLGDKPEFLE